MAQRSWSLQDAKNRFSEVVEAARRSPQTVTKHGKPAVVVVYVAEYERLRRFERAHAPSFADALLAMPQDDGEFSRDAVRIRDVEQRRSGSVPSRCLRLQKQLQHRRSASRRRNGRMATGLASMQWRITRR